MKRIFDILLGIFLGILLSIPILIIALFVYKTSEGGVIFWSRRVGKNNLIFKMPKFRSMEKDTPDLASDLLIDPNSYLSPIGGFLRKYSLDELPQLYSVIKGDMSFVGPRPALHNQIDLISMRKELGVDLLKPGITGWAQINGRDSLSLEDKVELDYEYLKIKSFYLDLKILFLTFFKVINKKNISH